MPGDGFEEWKYADIAVHFFEKYKYDYYEEQDTKFYNIVKIIISIVEKEYIKERLDKIGVWKWTTLNSGKK